jgi:hypothetical protein
MSPASSRRYQIIAEFLRTRYGPSVPVTDAMVRAVLDGLDQEDQEHPGPGTGQAGGAADGSGSPPAG